MTLGELRERWEHRRDVFAMFGASVDGAKLVAEVLADLDAFECASADEVLTLADAATESGYSAEHLRHLVASGQLTNAGRKHAPRIKRSDLPRKLAAKTTERASAASDAYNADADALSIVGRLAGRR
jgi:hypothetical protein